MCIANSPFWCAANFLSLKRDENYLKFSNGKTRKRKKTKITISFDKNYPNMLSVLSIQMVMGHRVERASAAHQETKRKWEWHCLDALVFRLPSFFFFLFFFWVYCFFISFSCLTIIWLYILNNEFVNFWITKKKTEK